MWQKINPVKLEIFENTRITVHNSLQLVSAAARAYLPSDTDDRQAELSWDSHRSMLWSKPFGPDHGIRVSLDMLKFVLSIRKNSGMTEHLVLSGMSYPLAFGWLQVKLEKLGLDPELFHDRQPYQMLDYRFDHSRELGVNDTAAEELVKYFSNAEFVLSQVRRKYTNSTDLRIRPMQFDLSFTLPLQDHNMSMTFGFCPGDPSFIEPYFYVSMSPGPEQIEQAPELSRGFWFSGEWMGTVLMWSDIANLDMERELTMVRNFYEEAAIACASMFKKV